MNKHPQLSAASKQTMNEINDQIQQSVTVTKLEGEYAWVKSSNGSGCGSCSSKNACGSMNFLKPYIDAKMANKGIKIKNTLGVYEGDQVVIGLSASQLLTATLLVYIQPLLLLFLFAVVGKLLFGEAASALFGIVGLFAGLYLVKRTLSRRSQLAETSLNTGFEPKMLKRESIQDTRRMHFTPSVGHTGELKF